MNVSSVSGVKIYDLSQAKSSSLANTLLKGKQRTRSYTSNKIDLLQDFSFPSYSRCVKFSKDGRFILASGGYKPRIKMFDVQEVSLKFERYCDSDIVDLEILSDDYSKFLLLSENRTLEFHTKFGLHETVRLPQNGRSLSYDVETNDVYVATSGNLLHRFNLTEGRFRAPFELSCGGGNAVRWNENHRLIAVCGEDGSLSMYDPRTRREAGQVAVSECPLSTTEFMMENGGLHLGVGDFNGKVSLFDLRSSHPMKTKQHMYSTRIHSLCFTSNKMCLSLDDKQIKGWGINSDENNFNLESSFPGEMSQLCVAPLNHNNNGKETSGLVMATGNCSERVQMFFISSLGPAPNWARYLESVTDELEMTTKPVSSSSFENFRFVTKSELEDLNMQSLIGSAELKPWMHGYFIETTSFEKLRAVMSNPHGGKMKGAAAAPSKQDDRIQLQKRVRTKVNPELAQRAGGDLDDRFNEMFSDPAFLVNEDSAEFRLKHPNRSKGTKSKKEVPVPLPSRPRHLSPAVVAESSKSSRLVSRPAPSSLPSFLDLAPAPNSKQLSRGYEVAESVPLGKRLEQQQVPTTSRIVKEGGNLSITFLPKSPPTATSKKNKKKTVEQ